MQSTSMAWQKPEGEVAYGGPVATRACEEPFEGCKGREPDGVETGARGLSVQKSTRQGNVEACSPSICASQSKNVLPYFGRDDGEIVHGRSTGQSCEAQYSEHSLLSVSMHMYDRALSCSVWNPRSCLSSTTTRNIETWLRVCVPCPHPSILSTGREFHVHILPKLT